MKTSDSSNFDNLLQKGIKYQKWMLILKILTFFSIIGFPLSIGFHQAALAAIVFVLFIGFTIAHVLIYIRFEKIYIEIMKRNLNIRQSFKKPK